MLTKTDKALDQFKQGYNCAQSILTTFGDEYGLERTTALRIATGFGAGMGRQLETCGLLTGAFMVIGMKHGMETPDQKENKEAAFAMVQKLTSEFRAKHGSHLCRALTRYDQLATEEEIQRFGSDPIRAETCRACLKSVGEFLENNL